MNRTTIRGRENSNVKLISHDDGYDVTDETGRTVLKDARFLTALKKYGELDAVNRKRKRK